MRPTVFKTGPWNCTSFKDFSTFATEDDDDAGKKCYKFVDGSFFPHHQVSRSRSFASNFYFQVVLQLLWPSFIFITYKVHPSKRSSSLKSPPCQSRCIGLALNCKKIEHFVIKYSRRVLPVLSPLHHYAFFKMVAYRVWQVVFAREQKSLIELHLFQVGA